jgi:glycosyltransferase involved in cell wall biosynthesis
MVYIEAMSHGLPVIYTRGQGIDGYFEDGEVGHACTPSDAPQIADRLAAIHQRYGSLSLRAAEVSAGFTWSGVADRFQQLDERIGAAA